MRIILNIVFELAHRSDQISDVALWPLGKDTPAHSLSRLINQLGHRFALGRDGCFTSVLIARGCELAGPSRSVAGATAVRAEFGSRFEKMPLLDENAVLALRGRLTWAHDWDDNSILQATLPALPGACFFLARAAPRHDFAVATFAREVTLRAGVSLMAKFDGEFASAPAGRGAFTRQFAVDRRPPATIIE